MFFRFIYLLFLLIDCVFLVKVMSKVQASTEVYLSYLNTKRKTRSLNFDVLLIFSSSSHDVYFLGLRPDVFRFLAAYGILALVSMAAVSFGLFTDDFISVVSNTMNNFSRFVTLLSLLLSLLLLLLLLLLLFI